MIFLTMEQVIDFHAEILKEFGGAQGIRDIGLLISAIEMPKTALFGEFLHTSICQ
jgi:death on curing protein